MPTGPVTVDIQPETCSQVVRPFQCLLLCCLDSLLTGCSHLQHGLHSYLGFFMSFKVALAFRDQLFSAPLSLCLSLSEETGSTFGLVSVCSNTPTTNYATVTLTAAHTGLGLAQCCLCHTLSSTPLLCPHEVVEFAFRTLKSIC